SAPGAVPVDCALARFYDTTRRRSDWAPRPEAATFKAAVSASIFASTLRYCHHHGVERLDDGRVQLEGAANLARLHEFVLQNDGVLRRQFRTGILDRPDRHLVLCGGRAEMAGLGSGKRDGSAIQHFFKGLDVRCQI